MNSTQNKIAKKITYPLLIQKWESEFYYFYANDIDSPIDCKKVWSDIFKYDIIKGHTVWEPLLAPILL